MLSQCAHILKAPVRNHLIILILCSLILLSLRTTVAFTIHNIISRASARHRLCQHTRLFLSPSDDEYGSTVVSSSVSSNFSKVLLTFSTQLESPLAQSENSGNYDSLTAKSNKSKFGRIVFNFFKAAKMALHLFERPDDVAKFDSATTVNATEKLFVPLFIDGDGGATASHRKSKHAEVADVRVLQSDASASRPVDASANTTTAKQPSPSSSTVYTMAVGGKQGENDATGADGSGGQTRSRGFSADARTDVHFTTPLVSFKSKSSWGKKKEWKGWTHAGGAWRGWEQDSASWNRYVDLIETSKQARNYVETTGDGSGSGRSSQLSSRHAFGIGEEICTEDGCYIELGEGVIYLTDSQGNRVRKPRPAVAESESALKERNEKKQESLLERES